MIHGTVSRPKYRRAIAWYLIRWLREAKKRRGYNRVVRLILDLQRFTKIVDTETICVEWNEFYGINLPKRGYKTAEWETLFRRISRQLERHKVFPQLARFDEGKWLVDWRSNKRKDWMHSSIADLREQPKTETDAVMEAVKAATSGHINLIHPCRRCGEWFTALIKTQVYCSRDCQRRDYWTSASWKAHRRRYMRRYRRVKALPNIK